MSQKIIVSVNELEDLANRLQKTADEINASAGKAVIAAKNLKNECDASAMMLIPSLSTCATHYNETMNRHVRTLRIAIESYQNIDKEIAKRAEDIETELLDSLVVVSVNYRKKYQDYLSKQISKETLDSRGLRQKYGHSGDQNLYTRNDIYDVGDNHYLKSNGKQVYGECTTVAAAQLVNNRLAYLGIDATYSVEDAWHAQNNSAPNDTETYYVADRGFDYVKESAPTTLDGYMELLSKHPEGITIGFPDKHTIVLSKFTVDENNNVHFWGIDGSGKDTGGQEVDLLSTWMCTGKYKNIGSYEDLLLNKNYINTIGYLDLG